MRIHEGGRREEGMVAVHDGRRKDWKEGRIYWRARCSLWSISLVHLKAFIAIQVFYVLIFATATSLSDPTTSRFWACI